MPHGLGVTQLGSSRALLVSQNAPGSLPLRRERALCLSRETVINGCSVRSVMDQQCSFPRFPTPAVSLEGWQPARKSIVLLSQPSPRKLTPIHPPTLPELWDHGFSAVSTMPVLVHLPTQRTNIKATYQRPRLVPNQSFSWLDGSRALARSSCWMAESDIVNQPLSL